MVVTRGAERNYLAIRGFDDGRWESRYTLAQYSFTSEGDLLVWTPDAFAFDELIESGRLTGQVDRSDTVKTVLLG